MAKPQRRETTTEGVGGSDPPSLRGESCDFRRSDEKKIGRKPSGDNLLYYFKFRDEVRVFGGAPPPYTSLLNGVGRI